MTIDLEVRRKEALKYLEDAHEFILAAWDKTGDGNLTLAAGDEHIAHIGAKLIKAVR